jgi:transcriptional regulator with XRE-family HTH domain
MEPASTLDPARGRRIQDLRRRRGYTSAPALADAIGAHPRTVDNIEAGKPISGPILARLAEVLKTTPGYLWTGEEDAEPADPVSVLRARVDRIAGRIAQDDGDRAVALRAHDKRVEDELGQIRERLGDLAQRQTEAALVLPDLVSEVRELRAAVDKLRRSGAGRRQSEADS